MKRNTYMAQTGAAKLLVRRLMIIAAVSAVGQVHLALATPGTVTVACDSWLVAGRKTSTVTVTAGGPLCLKWVEGSVVIPSLPSAVLDPVGAFRDPSSTPIATVCQPD